MNTKSTLCNRIFDNIFILTSSVITAEQLRASSSVTLASLVEEDEEGGERPEDEIMKY